MQPVSGVHRTADLLGYLLSEDLDVHRFQITLVHIGVIGKKEL